MTFSLKTVLKNCPNMQELIIPQAMREKAKEMSEEGIRLIASWTTIVLEQSMEIHSPNRR